MDSDELKRQTLLQRAGRFAGQVGKSMARPFVKTAQNIGAAGLTIAQLAYLRNLSKTNPQRAAQIASKIKLGKGFKTEEEMSQISEDPLKAIYEQGLKPSAGVAAYTVPFGRGATSLTKSILPGAAAGGMFGFSGTPEEATAGETLKRVGTGAAIGGTLAFAGEKLGGVLGKLKSKLSQKMKGAIEKAKAKKPKRLDIIGKEAAKEEVKLGLAPTGKEIQKYKTLARESEHARKAAAAKTTPTTAVSVPAQTKGLPPNQVRLAPGVVEQLPTEINAKTVMQGAPKVIDPLHPSIPVTKLGMRPAYEGLLERASNLKDSFTINKIINAIPDEAEKEIAMKIYGQHTPTISTVGAAPPAILERLNQAQKSGNWELAKKLTDEIASRMPTKFGPFGIMKNPPVP